MKFKDGSACPAPDVATSSNKCSAPAATGLWSSSAPLRRSCGRAGSRAGIDGLFLRILWQERFPAVSYLSFWWRADFCLYSLNNYFQKVLDILAEVVIMQITICAALAVR